MNHIFAPYLGVFMDVYLDDIVIYSDTLSSSKLHFLEAEMKVLGRIVDEHGIRMDRGFLGSVGYLADDIANVRIPMGVLTSLTGSTSSFHWDFTHQRAERCAHMAHYRWVTGRDFRCGITR